MSIHRNIYRERFIEAIGGVEELKNYVYAGGNDERHLNYRLLVSEDFSVKKYTKLPLKIPSSKRFSHIPVELREMANDEEFTKKVLEDSDYTDVLRLALYNSYAKKFIMDNFGVRGLHLLPEYRLRAHQVKALTWMAEREKISHYGVTGGILCLEMGLGKTLTAVTHSLIRPRDDFPTLVIASKTVMHQAWKSDCFEKFFPNDKVKVLYLHKDFMGKDIKNVTREDLAEYDFVVTSYDVCTQTCKKGEFDNDVCVRGESGLHKDKIIEINCRTRNNADNPSATGTDILYCTPWTRVICDESQRFANPTTYTYKAIMAIYGKYKWCLTGTPIRNYDTDIWAQLRFCGYNGITIRTEWKRYGLRKFTEHNLNTCILSITTKDAGVELPPREIIPHMIDFSDMEDQVYKFILGKARVLYDQMLSGLVSFSCMLAIFIRLRQCCIAPHLMTIKAEREKAMGKDADDEVEALQKVREMLDNSPLGRWVKERTGDAGINSSKIREIIRIIKSVPTEKFIIFSMFTSCLDLVSESISVNAPDITCVQVDGDTTGEERSALLDKFKEDPDTRILLMTYKVGSEGLNLTQASRVICIEPWWSPSVVRQGEKRAWRPGQTQTVKRHDLIINIGSSRGNESIEGKIQQICHEKDMMASAYLHGSEYKMKKGSTGLDKATLGKILGVNRW